MNKANLKRKPTFAESILPIIAMLLLLFYGTGVMGWATEPLLIIVAAIAALVAIRVGVTWSELLDEIANKIAKGMPAILILITVGLLIGSWKASGTIPMMIYYGIQMVSPQYLLVTAFLITALVSVVTGTSWGSVGTMGVALMGIASGLNVSLPATAGAVIAGSYFGDKMSPLSDTTNLAPIAAGSDLYGHIRHMFWTTVPATIVSLIVYAVAGAQASSSATHNSEAVQVMLSTLNMMYSWSWLLLLPVVIVLVGSIMKMPTIPVMLGSSIFASIMAIFIQHITLANVLKCMVSGFNVSMLTASGFNPKTVAWAVTRLINGGGMASIMSTTLLVFCAFCFAGIMSRAGCLKVVLEKLLSIVTNTGGLIASTVAACLTMVLTTGSSYLSILIPGEMFRDAYKAKNLAAVNLSRTLEDSATVVVPLVPWSAAGAYMTATLGVPTLAYLPWAVLCYTGFLFALFYGFTGIGIKKLTQKEIIEAQKVQEAE